MFLVSAGLSLGRKSAEFREKQNQITAGKKNGPRKKKLGSKSEVAQFSVLALLSCIQPRTARLKLAIFSTAWARVIHSMCLGLLPVACSFVAYTKKSLCDYEEVCLQYDEIASGGKKKTKHKRTKNERSLRATAS